MRKYPFILILIIIGIQISGAQTVQDDTDIQSWNDFQIIVPMTGQFDFFLQGAGRFGNNVSQLSERRIAAGFIYKLTKSFSLTPFYLNAEARNINGKFCTEHQLNLRGTYRFPITYQGFGFTHRSQYEYRMRSPRNSWRYGSMLTVDKNIPKKIIPKAKFFVADEGFYDSITKKFNRNRFSTGITETLTKNLSVDIYYMRQNDGYSHPGNLNVIWTSFKLRL